MNIDRLARERAVVHCNSIEKAIAFLKACDEAGYTWQSGDNLRADTCWDHFGKETCYRFTGGDTLSYADKPYYDAAGYAVIEYAE